MINTGKTAVMYGAGNIGRGFIGQIFSDSGFEVVFIDINSGVINALNYKKSYTQVIVDFDETNYREITPVRAVDGNNRPAAAKEIANCYVMAVSVGAAVLPFVAPVIADGLALRKHPLNILVCENLIHAPEILRGYVSEHLPDLSVLKQVGFVGTTIGRMVPVMPQQQKEADPTCIAVEKFCSLPVDADVIIPPMPELKHTVHCSPFAFEEGKKLYVHNMGHALAAYFGAIKGYLYIWQAIEDDFIKNNVRQAMLTSSIALSKKYNECIIGLTAYTDDLISRFGNKSLGDTIARVGGDPMRKLAPGDRLTGAVDLCKEQGVDYKSILAGISAAIRYNTLGDPSADRLQKRLKECGIKAFLTDYCGLSVDDADKCCEFI